VHGLKVRQEVPRSPNAQESWLSLACVADARLRRIGDNSLAIMRGLINSLAVYPVVLRGVANQEEFKRVIAMANEELARIDAEPFVRLSVAF
jgi:hypothetical protein